MSDNENTKETHTKPKKNIILFLRQRPRLVYALIVVALVISVCVFLYWQDMQSKIYIEKAEISAPIISLGPKVPGTIDAVYVQEGDEVSRGQRLVKVGDQIVTANTSGIVVWVENTPGQMVSSLDANLGAVVKIIDPQSLRVVGHIQEDKGLGDIRVGQRVVFTVDAFGSKQYEGTVESIGATARQSSVVFSISDTREEKEFDVTASFDVLSYPELKNGMSAKMWVYK